MKVYGVTGLPGSGKSIISRLAKNEGVHIISMGDVVRKEAEKQHCSPGAAAVNLRKKYGNNIIAERCVEEIIQHSRNRYNKKTVTKIYKTNNNNKSSHRKFKKIEQDVYIIEGIRSPFEVNIFKKKFKNFKLIAIHSNPEVRFNRLKRRKRIDDSPNYKTFLERDKRELKFGIGNVIALADFMLVNEGPIPQFKNVVRGLINNEIKPKHNTYNNYNKNKGKQNRRHKQSQKQPKKYNKQPRNNRNNKNTEIILEITDDISLLSTIRKKIKENNYNSLIDNIINRNLEDDKTYFYINKQSAFNNKFHITDESISTLGDIEVIIESNKIEEVINYLNN